MPIIIVEAIEGRTIEQKKGLVRDITEAVVKNFNIEPEKVSVIIHEFPAHNFGKAGELH